MLFFDEIKARLSVPMPNFWKKLQKRSAATSAAFTTLTVTVASIQNHLPAILPTILGGCAAFFGGVSAVCSLAVDDPTALTPGPTVAATEPVPSAVLNPATS